MSDTGFEGLTDDDRRAMRAAYGDDRRKRITELEAEVTRLRDLLTGATMGYRDQIATMSAEIERLGAGWAADRELVVQLEAECAKWKRLYESKQKEGA